jgi:mRNA interferase MazF
MEVKRFHIYFADLDPTLGRELNKFRPVVVISKKEMNKYSDTVVVCPLTTSLHPQWRSRIQISCANRQAEIAVDQIRTISRKRLGRQIDVLGKDVAAKLTGLIEMMYC